MVFTQTKMMSQMLIKKREICLCFRTELNMRESGTKKLTCDTEEDTRYGLMDLFMKAIGNPIRLMVEED
jgi:hypothetical protein